MATAHGEDMPDALAAYLVEIEGLPALDQAQESALFRRIADGVEVERARHELIQSNLRLVVSIAREYAEPGRRLLDLIQEGNIGLIRALETFDSGGGVRFAEVAARWIRQAIERGIADLDPGDSERP